MRFTTAIAMSGGVDSLVAAHLLQRQGHDLVGIHFTTGFESQAVDLSSIEDQLDIKIHQLDLSAEFEQRVVDYFVETYARGRTPNPCVVCNRTIKFGVLAQRAKALGAVKIATGHYADTRAGSDGRIALVKGTDGVKDQSYFLAMLTQEQLKQALFPLGRMTKDQVREIARKNRLLPVEAKESQDICFIKGPEFPGFVASRLSKPPSPGNIVLADGTVVGRHRGLHCYTIGQRRGLNSPGPEPYYVKTIDMENNLLVVGGKQALYTTEVAVGDLNWITPPLTSSLKVTTKIRYSHKGAASTLNIENDGTTLVFDAPQLAVTPGQTAVFYRDREVLGAGIIQ